MSKLDDDKLRVIIWEWMYRGSPLNDPKINEATNEWIAASKQETNDAALLKRKINNIFKEEVIKHDEPILKQVIKIRTNLFSIAVVGVGISLYYDNPILGFCSSFCSVLFGGLLYSAYDALRVLYQGWDEI